MQSATRRLVRTRAKHRCEYCRLEQKQAPFALFHVDHVIPRQHGGGDKPDNLTLACHHCNLHKGSNLTGIDPASRQIMPLFNLLKEVWSTHFVLQGPLVSGLTPVGRATVRVRAMNAPDRIQLRAELQKGGDL